MVCSITEPKRNIKNRSKLIHNKANFGKDLPHFQSTIWQLSSDRVRSSGFSGLYELNPGKLRKTNEDRLWL